MGSFENESDINEYFFSGTGRHYSLICGGERERFGSLLKAQFEIPYLRVQYQYYITFVQRPGHSREKNRKRPAMIILEAF